MRWYRPLPILSLLKAFLLDTPFDLRWIGREELALCLRRPRG